MTELFKNSLIFNKLGRIGRVISQKWEESECGWLVTRNLNDIKTRNSVLYRILRLLFSTVLCFQLKGRLGDKFKSSVVINLISHYEFGVYAMIFLAPIIPTMMCVGLALLTFISFFINKLINNDYKFKIDSCGIMLIILIGMFFIYSVTSFSAISSLKIFAVYFVFMMFTFLVVQCGSDKKRLNIMLSLFITSGFFVSVYGIYQQFFGSNVGHAWLDEEMFEDISLRVYSTLENPNVLGEYLLFLIPLCGAVIYGVKQWRIKLLSFVVLGSAGLCMIFTQSRGCWLGLILAAVVFALLIDRRLVFCGIICLLFLPMILPESIITRFMSIGDMNDTSTSYRVYIWLGTLRLLKDYWWNGIGIGQGAFDKVYPLYSYNAIVAPHAHNLYLQLFVETGIAGLLTFITTMLVSLKKILVGYIVGKKTLYGILCGAIISGVLGFLLQGMFDYIWYNYRVFAIFWIFIGMGIAARRCSCD